MSKSVAILNDFNTLTLKQIFWKTKTFFKKLVYRFLVESTKIDYFHTKLPYQKPMLRQIEWWVQNGPIAKNRVLPVTILFFFSKFCFSLRTPYKELISCTSDLTTHIRTFCKGQSFIWQWFFHVSLMKSMRPILLALKICYLIYATIPLSLYSGLSK